MCKTQLNYKVGEIYQPLNEEIIYSKLITGKMFLETIFYNIEYDGIVVEVTSHPFKKYLIKTKSNQ